MKVIGRIELKSTESKEVTNLPYANGFIVELTEKESRSLKLLQAACNGYGWDTSRMFDNSMLGKPEDVDMVEAFDLVRLFVRARFAVNDFKKMVSELEHTLNRLEE